MSYCRWSCDSFRCDLYCYEDVSGGWTTHVAGNRRDLPDDVRDPPWGLFQADSAEWMRQHNAFLDKMRKYDIVPIDLPHAGESFNDDSLEEFRDRLIWLRSLGYNFPDDVLEDVDAEIAEAQAISCRSCADTGHVCENHPDKPWHGMVGEDHPDTCACGGAGMPCPECCTPVPQDGTHKITDCFIPRARKN